MELWASSITTALEERSTVQRYDLLALCDDFDDLTEMPSHYEGSDSVLCHDEEEVKNSVSAPIQKY